MKPQERRALNVPKTIVFFTHLFFALVFVAVVWLWGLDHLELNGLWLITSLIGLSVAVWFPVIGSAVVAYISLDYPNLPFDAPLLAFVPVITTVLIAMLYSHRFVPFK